jgi:hypothetical protein
MTRPDTRAHRPSQGSRPDKCHPVDGPPPALAQVRGAGSRERVARHADPPRRRANLMPKLLPKKKQRLRCGVVGTA